MKPNKFALSAGVLAVWMGRGPVAQCATPVAADAVGDDPLNPIVVTATRTPQPLERALEAVILIDRAALEDSLALDVGDVLRFHAGLDIGRSGGPGQPLSLFIRGANSDQSIIMIDGVRINAGTIAGAPLQNLAPELFERIEVVEGPRSAIYGTDAIGGVVNLITRSSGTSGADVMLDYGRYSTGEFTADGTYADGDTRLTVALTGQRSAGFPPLVGDTLDAGYKNLSGIAVASGRIGGIELGAFYWQSTGTTDYANGNYGPGEYTTFTSFSPLSENFTNSALAVHAAADLTDRWHARLTLSRIVDDLRQEDIDDVYQGAAVGDFDHTSRDALDVQNDVTLESAAVRQRVTFGALLYDEHTDSLSYGTGYAIGTNTQTYYLQDQIDAGANHLLVAAGSFHHPAFGNHETWNAEYGYDLAPAMLLIATAGTAFRAPDATDRFGYGGNPNLLPESSRNVELGFKARLGTAQLVTLAAFQDTITDLIVSVPVPPDYAQYENENVDRARIRGVEATWEWHHEPWRARVEGSVQDPRNLSADASDTVLLRRSKHSFTLSGARGLGAGEIGLDVLQSGPREDIGAASGTQVSDAGYVLADVYGKYTLTPAWSIAVRLDNAFDRRYQLSNGYNTAARSASLSTRYRFR